MRPKIVDRVTKLAILLAVSIAVCNAQITEPEAKKLAASSECLRSASPGKPEFLRFTRLEDIEDDLFDLRIVLKAPVVKPAYVFSVSSIGTFITDKNEVISVSSSHGGRLEKIIVVSKWGEVFGLYGCESGDDVFPKLIKAIGSKIKDENRARTFGYLYYSLREDPERRWLVYKIRDIKHAAENYFFGRYPDRKAGSEFKRWMRKISQVKLPSEMGIVSTAEGEKYRVKIFYMKFSSKNGPQLFRDELIMDSNGGYTRQTKIVF
jgi:hypothetical protein